MIRNAHFDVLDLLKPRPAEVLNPMLTAKDLAQHIAVSRATIERWIRGRKLPPPDIHLRGIRRWRRETIRAWIESQGKPRRRRRRAGAFNRPSKRARGRSRRGRAVTGSDKATRTSARGRGGGKRIRAASATGKPEAAAGSKPAAFQP